jgi:dynein heavy chain
MNTYMAQFFCDDTIDVPGQRLSSLSTYVVPDEGPLSLYKEACAGMPQLDRPEAYGQHPNADISSQIEAGTSMLSIIVSLQPRTAESSGSSPEDTVYALASDLLSLIPEPVDIYARAGESDGSSLHTVLIQELQRYDRLLRTIRLSLTELQKGIKGLVVMSSDLEAVFQKLLVGQVPSKWLSAYPSLKPLASWARDLLERWGQMMSWCNDGVPKVFWLAGFTYPMGFLTALLQNAAREAGTSIDVLTWDFPVINSNADEITESPTEGAYIRGLFLEGAGWDHENSALCDPEPMQLIYNIPIIHFRPLESKKSKTKSTYACPLYLYPLRTGSRERPSFMLPVDLKFGAASPEVWTCRGTALLLALAE